jgi:protein ImuB
VRLVALNACARARGLEAGQALAQARAIAPDLHVHPHDPTADARLLASIADWADRYTPLVALTPPDGLMLDITGAAHLLGGEAALQADLVQRLAAQGFAVLTAIAGTPGGAHALAHGGRAGAIVADEALEAALAPLSVAGLRLDTDTVAGLRRAGLTRIGDLMERPRAPLAARFGARLLHRLDQALGRDEEAIGPRQPVAPAMVERRFAEPIVREDDVSAVALGLAGDLQQRLRERGEGACHAVLIVFRVDGAVRQIEISLAAPCRDATVLHGLLALRLAHLADPLDPGFGFDLVRLSATRTGPCPETAPALPAIDLEAGAAAGRLEHLTRLGDRLAARFGAANVRVPAIADAHLPEQAGPLRRFGEAALPAPAGPQGAPPSLAEVGPTRPLRLFEPPEPVEIMAEVPDGPPLRVLWRRQTLRVAAAEGPERMATVWWHGGGHIPDPGAGPRDYYRVVDEQGRRLWIYRDGMFEGGRRPPRWYVHGVFA